MNALTGEVAHDVAWARPPAIPGALILGYNGAARATREQVLAWAKPFLMGFESATTRSYAGGDAGEADAAFSCGSFDEVGYPRECGSWVCAADAPSTPAQYLANIEDYGYRYALRMILGVRLGPILVYGNPDAVEALCRGIRRAGLVALRWGVGTWGYGEGGGSNQPPTQADAELVQSGNTPGQADGTDLNWLYVLTAVFMAWFGPQAAPPPPADPPEESDMEVIHGPSISLMGDRRALLFGPGGVFLHDWFGKNNGLGMVQAAHDEVPTGTSEHVIRSDDPADPVWAKLVALADNPGAPAAGDGEQPPPPPDLSPVRAAVTALEHALTAAGA